MRTFTTVWWHWANRCLKEFMTGRKAFLILLVLGSFLVTKTGYAQTPPANPCDNINVAFDYDLDIDGFKTTYTWTIKDNGLSNAISHWGFDLNACPPTIVQQFLNATTASIKVGNGDWQTINYVYGEDKSQSCETGAVLKFDMGLTPGVTYMFKLEVTGWWSDGIADIYFKYGNNCCIKEIPNTDDCLEKICPVVLCNITKNTNNLCPGATNTYTAPANMSSYAWTVTGNGSVSGPTNERTVTVVSGNACGLYTVTLVTTKNGCNFQCNQTFTVTDTEKPVIRLSALGTVPCNPTMQQIEAAFGNATVTDNCSQGLIANGSLGQITGEGCNRSVTKTWNVSDACGNPAAAVSHTVTWIVDNTAPVVTNGATSFTKPLGCNPTNIEANFVAPTFDGGCSQAAVTPSLGAATGTGCNRSWTRSWEATDCSGLKTTITQILTWTVDNTAPVVTNSATSFTKPLGCNPSNIEANFVAPTFDGGCSNATVTATPGAASGPDCNKTWTRSWEATDCSGLKTTITQVLTWTVDNTAPVMSVTPATSIQAACGTLFADLPWQAPTWTDGCGAVTVVSTVTTPNAQQNSCPAVYTRIWTVRDACNNQASFTQTITVPCCTYCTYTQGYYGNPGGKACTGETGPNNLLTTQQLIQKALTSARFGGTMILGSGEKTVTIHSSEWQKIIDYLPGGGSSYPFEHSGSISISSETFKNKYTKKKGNSYGIDNTLLAQTLTLGLNIGISPNLYKLQLLPGMYLNTLEATSCGSITPIACTYDSYLPNQTLVGALSTKTVGGLYELANIALGGGQLPQGVNANMIAEAVDAINNLFDECKIFAGYSSSPISCSSTTLSNETRSENITERLSTGKLQVTASPNPYNDKVRFMIESPVSGQGSLEVYNLVGQKVETVFQGYLLEGRGQTIEYKVSPANRSTLIYILKVGGQQVTGKLINVK